MAFEALSSIPCEFESGNSVTITMPLPNVAPSEGEAKLYLSLSGSAVTNITATESGNDFTFTISAVASAALAPGDYSYAIRFTYTAGEVVTVAEGGVTVTPNPAANQTPSFAQSMVTLLEAVMAGFAATDRISVSFNGQSFQRANIKTYSDELVRYKAEVIRERAQAAARRGENPSKIYAPHFV